MILNFTALWGVMRFPLVFVLIGLVTAVTYGWQVDHPSESEKTGPLVEIVPTPDGGILYQQVEEWPPNDETGPAPTS